LLCKTNLQSNRFAPLHNSAKSAAKSLILLECGKILGLELSNPGVLGTVMRHYLCRDGTPHAGCVFVSSEAALLIALACFALSALPGDGRTPSGTVALATVTLAADQDLGLATCA
jgi:hypothetical protein